MLTQDLLVVMRTVLAAPVAVDDAAFRRRPEGNGHLRGPDRQIALHAVADSPADDPSGMQIQDHCEIHPSLARPNLSDVTSPFLVRVLSHKVAIRQVWRDVELVVAICRHFVFMRADDRYAILMHQTSNTAVAHV